jgi:hypothetical protein
MGFMDKAKKLAEQAQQKLDEAQESLNQGASPQHEPDPDGVRYDEHGRPIQDETPAATTPPPSAEPAPEAEPSPEPAPPPPTPTGDANPNPDPFKPLQQ